MVVQPLSKMKYHPQKLNRMVIVPPKNKIGSGWTILTSCGKCSTTPQLWVAVKIGAGRTAITRVWSNLSILFYFFSKKKNSTKLHVTCGFSPFISTSAKPTLHKGWVKLKFLPGGWIQEIVCIGLPSDLPLDPILEVRSLNVGFDFFIVLAGQEHSFLFFEQKVNAVSEKWGIFACYIWED